MSSQRGNPPTQEPQVENLTRYSPRSRRWSKRGLLGIKSRDFIVEGNTFLSELKQNLTGNQGNDPFDYEQKLPEDKQYEELGPAARVWRTYLEECALFDREMVEGWKDGLDVLLVFDSRVRTLKDAEQDAVRRSAESTDVYALSWLFSMSSNPSVQSIVAQSIGALPLKSVDLVRQHMKGVSLMCVEVINNCVGTQTVLEPTQQAKVERLIRAHLRVRRRDDKTWFHIST
ncbi:hypothetical protein ARMSODRAFT_957220, partial [Armillaria solidipes]